MPEKKTEKAVESKTRKNWNKSHKVDLDKLISKAKPEIQQYIHSLEAEIDSMKVPSVSVPAVADEPIGE